MWKEFGRDISFLLLTIGGFISAFTISNIKLKNLQISISMGYMIISLVDIFSKKIDDSFLNLFIIAPIISIIIFGILTLATKVLKKS